MVAKADWIWMPHAGHFICGDKCQFHLTTCVGDYIVSTVGEYLPDSAVREVMARSRGVNLKGQGDARAHDFKRQLGWESIGCNRLYETMVFPAQRSPDNRCCPWKMASPTEVDFAGYNDAEAALLGHMAMCEKWSHGLKS